jgi:hypothetical protein
VRHGSRHFYAVRAVRAGTSYELVARQLGHADVQMVARVYGRYAPRSDERDRWERIAAQLDESSATGRVEEMGTVVGTTDPVPAEGTTSQHPQVIGPRVIPRVAGVGLEPTTPAL